MLRFLCLSLFLPTIGAFPFAPGSCVPGANSLGGFHLSRNSPGNGTLESGGFATTLNGLALMEGASLFQFAEEPLALEISAPGGSFIRGFLAKIVDRDMLDYPISTGFLSSEDPLIQSPDVCTSNGIGAISHNSNVEKTSVAGVLNFPPPPSGQGTVFLEVTIVVSNSEAEGSVWYFSSYALSVGSALTTPSMAPPPPPSGTIVDVLNATEGFSVLTSLAVQAGLEVALASAGPITLFAPSNDAFSVLPEDAVTRLVDPTWSQHLADVLLYHALSDFVTSADLALGLELETTNEENITVTSLDPVTINAAVITTPDIIAENGIIHAINSVLLPPSVLYSILDFGSADENFSTLVSLATVTGLNAVLGGPGAFTLFAPTNEAFAKLDSATLEYLLDPDNILHLTEVLGYHVVSSVLYASELPSGNSSLTSFAGLDLSLSVSDAQILINDASVIEADVLANNGVVHTIDTVLIPPTFVLPTAAPTPEPTPVPSIAPTFPGEITTDTTLITPITTPIIIGADDITLTCQGPVAGVVCTADGQTGITLKSVKGVNIVGCKITNCPFGIRSFSSSFALEDVAITYELPPFVRFGQTGLDMNDGSTVNIAGSFLASGYTLFGIFMINDCAMKVNGAQMVVKDNGQGFQVSLKSSVLMDGFVDPTSETSVIVTDNKNLGLTVASSAHFFMFGSTKVEVTNTTSGPGISIFSKSAMELDRDAKVISNYNVGDGLKIEDASFNMFSIDPRFAPYLESKGNTQSGIFLGKTSVFDTNDVSEVFVVDNEMCGIWVDSNSHGSFENVVVKDNDVDLKLSFGSQVELFDTVIGDGMITCDDKDTNLVRGDYDECGKLPKMDKKDGKKDDKKGGKDKKEDKTRRARRHQRRGLRQSE